MANKRKWNSTYAEMSDKYGVPVTTLKWWNTEGHNLNDDNLLKSLCANSKNGTKDIKLNNLKLTNELGISGALKRLRETELELSKGYEKAIKNGDSNSESLRRAWLDILSALMKAEKDAPEVQSLNDETITKDEVSITLTKIFSGLRKSLEQLPVRVTKGLAQDVGMKILPEIQLEINTYIEELFNTNLIKESNG